MTSNEPYPILSDDTASPTRPQEPDARPLQDCPQCGFPMPAIRGSKQAVCRNCGFKDSCCY